MCCPNAGKRPVSGGLSSPLTKSFGGKKKRDEYGSKRGIPPGNRAVDRRSGARAYFQIVIRLEVVITLLVLYGILCMISLFGNFLVCYVILKNKRLHTATNFFIANLAISDLLVTFMNVPFNIARNMLDDWPLGELPCHMVNFSLSLTTYVSTYTLTSIALDRHRVVLKPLSRRLSRRFALVILILIWLVALCLSLPYGLYMRVVKQKFLITREYARCSFVGPANWANFRQFLTVMTFILQYLVPLTLIAVAYGRIVQSLWARTQVGAVTANQQLSRSRAKKKSIKLLIAVVVVFAICWFPLHMYHLLTNFHPDREKFIFNSVAFFSCHWIAISSTCYNPFVYCWLNENFREEVKSRFYWFFVPCRRRRKMRSSMDAEITLLEGDGRNNRVQSSRLDEATSGAGGSGYIVGTTKSDSGKCPSVRKDPTTTSSDVIVREIVNISADHANEIDLLPNFHNTCNGGSHLRHHHHHHHRNNQFSTWPNKYEVVRSGAKKKKAKLYGETKSISNEDSVALEDLHNALDRNNPTSLNDQDNNEVTSDSNKQVGDLSGANKSKTFLLKDSVGNLPNGQEIDNEKSNDGSMKSKEKDMNFIKHEAEDSLVLYMGSPGGNMVRYHNAAKRNLSTFDNVH
ncbi:orphan G-protein coupled receptor 40 [Plakobranchus ocellatus]|uniref:Orphan G-protein coupled receptor 40 n=1 Tax=Plakobranchus ocellatus TaxID=259542 RepID=A0AAV4B274_9GAST|nr:orphan G-protein coupled receptor 40 [Plakobranchus ocellatus]